MKSCTENLKSKYKKNSAKNMISLERLCLNLIVQKFERFHFAFTVSKDEILKDNFEFLQRQYSYELVSELYKEKNLRDEFVEFVLNKHLRIIDHCWLRNSHYLLENVLHRLPNLIRIFYPLLCDDITLENITKFCPKITEINMVYSDVTNAGIKYLCKNENGVVPCPELKNIFIEETYVTDEGVKYLIQNLPSLEHVDSPNVPEILYSLHKEDLPELQKVRSYNLIDLYLLKLYRLPYYTDLLKICLTLCPRLKAIACCISNSEQLSLFCNTNLETLRLKFLRNGPKININNFLKINGCNLRSLRVYNCAVSITDMARNCPKLKQLYLSNISFLCNDVDSKPMFRCLSDCTFQNAKNDNCTSRAVRLFLLSSPKLESVSFRWCVLSQDIRVSVLNFCRNNTVKEITFKGPIVEVDFVKEILITCSASMTLNLNRCHFRIQESVELDEFVKKLPNKPSIKSSDLIDISDIDSEEDTDEFFENPVTWDDYLEFLDED